ncbi:MAG: NPCBM/NEW2 domain-containing protein [Thermoguttaceae bacterium]|nr:NPCBM/NEW2 domain-containing protein [Thermoguttaceae bacterium]
MKKFVYGIVFGILVLAGALFFSLSAEDEKEPAVVWLDELGPALGEEGWNMPTCRTSAHGKPIQIGNMRFDRGVGVHTPRILCVELTGETGTFAATVGIDDDIDRPGDVEFIVRSDEKILWRSGMIGSWRSVPLEVSLDGVTRLYLQTLQKHGERGNHADWADARFIGLSTRPAVVPIPENLCFPDNGDDPFSRLDEARLQWEALSRDLRNGIPEHAAKEALNEQATIFSSDRDPLDILLRRSESLAAWLEQNDPETDRRALRTDLTALKVKSAGIAVENIEARRGCFAETLTLLRRLAFTNPLLDFTDILFVKHFEAPMAETKGNHMIDQFFGFQARPGGGVFLLKDAFADTPRVINLLEGQKVTEGRNSGQELDQNWSFIAPELNWNTDQILFAAADASLPRATFSWSKENSYQIYRANFDPDSGRVSRLIQLTDEPFDSFDPCYLPNGRVAFISMRRGGYGRCHPRPAPTYTLNSMNIDGSDPVVLSWHETNEWAPSVDRNGMILYTRWDYVDRGANNAHHPWITYPDGRDARALVGNYHEMKARVPIMELDVRQVPESNKITATAAAHHGQSYGALVLVDPYVPDDNLMSTTRRITPEQVFPEAEQETDFPCPMQYASCYPLSELFYLCVYDPFAEQGNSGCLNNSNRYGIYLLDAFGNRILLYRDPHISCREPIPVRTRNREPVIPHQTLVGKPHVADKAVPPQVDELPKTGTVGLMNVYNSKVPFPGGVKIKRLRIVQLLPKTTPLGHNPAIGAGMQKNARQVLGTVPVEEDGSAYFTVPVNVPIYFQALDENGVAVQSMRTDAYVHPGEVLLCQGCHEDRLTATDQRTAPPLATQRAPSEITPDPDGSRPINFVRLIQPILDSKCVNCHDASDDERAIDLSDYPKDAHFSNAFTNLTKYCFYYDDYLWDEPRTEPMNFGSRRSRLYEILTSDHHGVELTPEELYRFTLWMDNNCDFYGAYIKIPEQRRGEVVTPDLE